MSKKFIVELEFEDEMLAGDFGAYWLDGGGCDGFYAYDENSEECFYTDTDWITPKTKTQTIKKFKITRSDTKVN